MIETVDRDATTTHFALEVRGRYNQHRRRDRVRGGHRLPVSARDGPDPRHEIELAAYALEKLSAVPGLTIYGPRNANQRGRVVAFTVEGIHPHDLAQVADYDGIALRAGHHFCQVLATR